MTLLSTRRVYTGRVVSLDIDTVEFPNHTTGDLEMVRHVGASAVLPLLDAIDSADPRVILIRQFRHATGGYLWEIPAGLRNPGEAPEATAARELREETGYRCTNLRTLGRIWTTPGFTDEVIHLFLATGLTAGESSLESDEILEIHTLPWSAVLRMVGNGEIDDGKTVAAVLHVEARLR